MTLLLLLATGVVIGAVLGLTGAGGSILAVPLLMLLLGFEPVTAMGLALGVVAISSAFGSIKRIAAGDVLWLPALLMGSWGFLFAPIGRNLASSITEPLLLTGFCLLACVIALRMWRQSVKEPEQASVVRANTVVTASEALRCEWTPAGKLVLQLRCIVGLSVGGVATGLLSGLFGVGGGFLIVPFLNQLQGVTMMRSVATSLVIITVVASSGFITQLLMQPMDWPSLLPLAIGGVGGMVLGSISAAKLAGPYLQRIFAAAIVVLSLLALLL